MKKTVQGGGNLGEGSNKSPVISHKAQERANLFDSGGNWPVLNSSHLLQIYGDSLTTYDMSQVFDLLSDELALPGLQFEAMALAISRWNVAKALHKPKGILENSYKPNGVVNAVSVLLVRGRNLDLPVPAC